MSDILPSGDFSAMTTSLLSKLELEIPQALPSVDHSRRLAKGFTLAFTLIVGGLLWFKCADKVFLTECSRIWSTVPIIVQETCVNDLLASPLFFTALFLCFLLEKVRPARAGEGTLSNAGTFDVMWVIPKFLFYASVWLIYIELLKSLYTQYLGFLTIRQLESWPWLGKFAVGFLVVDFLSYLSHRVRHKVETFWAFHAVHHSQKKLNFFAAYRTHAVDDFIKYALEAIPLFMLGQSVVHVLLLDRLMYLYTVIYHGNIRSNYGWLRYILVSPQHHRVHHSIEPQHQNKNFGFMLSIWDQMFGTQYRNYDEYPASGTKDVFFPNEESQSPRQYVRTFLEQFFYPFRLPRF